MADLLRRLGNIPADRVRLHPPPGTATEEDLIRNNESKFRTAICELVDGTLVEKPVGWEESAIAGLIIQALLNFVRPRKLGTVLAPDGMLRLVPGLLRAPDVSFLARGKLTRYKRGGERYPSVAADLAVEVISKSNTKAEIARKLDEYFAAGTRLAWVVDPKTMTVRVHTAPEESVVLRPSTMSSTAATFCPGSGSPVRDSSTWKIDRAEDRPAPTSCPSRPSSPAHGRNSRSSTTTAPRKRRGWRPGSAPWPIRGSTSAPARGNTRAGWARSTRPGDTPSRGKFSQRKFEAECLAEYAEIFPVGLRRLQLLPVPQPRLLATSSSASRPIRSGSPSRSPRRSPSRPGPATPVTAPGPARPTPRSSTPGCSTGEFAAPAGALPRPGRRPDLRVRHDPEVDLRTAAEFPGRLDAFLGALARRVSATRSRSATPSTSAPATSPTLAAHGVAHVFNAWTRMPDLAAQAELPGAFTADFTVVRALLRPGRTYEQAVSALRALSQRPANPTRPPATASARSPIGSRRRQKPAFVFVNNRLEGHAPTTIEAVAEALVASR